VTMEKCHLTWDNFMVHDVNNSLLYDRFGIRVSSLLCVSLGFLYIDGARMQ
jgi:hypothetical protein